MSDLSALHNLSGVRAAPDRGVVTRAREGLPDGLPVQLTALYEVCDGFYTDAGIVVYEAEWVVERNATFEVAEYAPGFVLFGDDSGGRGFLLAAGASRSPVYACDLGDLDTDRFDVVGGDLGTWLAGLEERAEPTTAAVTTLRQVLRSPSSLRFGDALYMSAAEEVTLDSACLAWDVDDVLDDGSDLPAAAAARGFEYVLDGQTVAGIVENARAQRPDASEDHLFEAFSFYLRSDAFIDWSVSRPEGGVVDPGQCQQRLDRATRAVLIVREALSAPDLMRVHRLLGLGLADIQQRVATAVPMVDVELFGNDHEEVGPLLRTLLAEFGKDASVHLCIGDDEPGPDNAWGPEVIGNILDAHEAQALPDQTLPSAPYPAFGDENCTSEEAE